MTALPEVAEVEVRVVVRVSATGPRVADAAGRLAEALRSALDLSEADVVLDPPVARVEPELRIIADSRRVLRRGVPVELTRLEFDLLHHLCANPHRVHRRTALMASVWRTKGIGDTRTVDVHVRRLRHKLGEAASVITTVRGVGYRVDHAGEVVVERETPVGR
ncbi:winged helix-turn-helix domain-containing protein [Saccharothrix texasensis]|uniref:Transcriptional regulator n=1 Tax=Saccharothrix texasensis TaxID=103734 RepID=A0A3N1H2J4_9PSEU|nr:winged helix-turn-helix domain-containing protein [Saccharothrix texasensis]ROP36731.1 transcriptional regulator [Saccharothrix texasensis]